MSISDNTNRERNEARITIDLLYFKDCPSYGQAWNDLLEVLVEEQRDATVRVTAVESPELAEAYGFPGSPTIKVDGVDLEGYEGTAALACRTYRENGGKGWPSKELIRSRIQAARDAR